MRCVGLVVGACVPPLLLLLLLRALESYCQLVQQYMQHRRYGLLTAAIRAAVTGCRQLLLRAAPAGGQRYKVNGVQYMSDMQRYNSSTHTALNGNSRTAAGMCGTGSTWGGASSHHLTQLTHLYHTSGVTAATAHTFAQQEPQLTAVVSSDSLAEMQHASQTQPPGCMSAPGVGMTGAGAMLSRGEGGSTAEGSREKSGVGKSEVAVLPGYILDWGSPSGRR